MKGFEPSTSGATTQCSIQLSYTHRRPSSFSEPFLARAHAALEGRDYVLPDDVKTLARPVLAHRLILSTQARLRGRDVEQLLAEVVERIPVPLEG